jgi:predicted DNA-binding transcriptional regulator AlpA
MQQGTKGNSELLDAREAAHLVGMSPRSFRSRAGELPPPVRFSARFVRWRRADLLDWVAKLATGPRRAPEPLHLTAARRRLPTPHSEGPEMDGGREATDPPLADNVRGVSGTRTLAGHKGDGYEGAADGDVKG